MTHAHQSTARLRVAAAQMDVRLGDLNVNLERARRFVSDAREERAEVVLLPELWSTGYDLDHAAAHAAANQTVVLPALASLAERHEICIAGSLLLADNLGRVRNTAVVHGPDGTVVSEYAKIHLFALMAENRYLAAGDATPTFSLRGCTAASAICYDLRFPELFRSYALEGARVVLLPAEWPAVRVAHWRTLVAARAIENQFFVVACNRAGTSGSTTFAGHSMIVDPWGKVLAEAGDGEALLVETLELGRVDEARSQIDILGDRRADLYGANFQLANHR